MSSAELDRYRKAVFKESSNRRLPVLHDISSKRLSVSFPQQIGWRRYDLEVAETCAPAGVVLAADFVKGVSTSGYVTALFENKPLEIIANGKFAPETVEVTLGGRLKGSIQRSSEDHYTISSSGEKASIRVQDSFARVERGDRINTFSLRIDTNVLNSHSNPNIVFEPNLQIDPFVVTGFLLALRMLYAPVDF
jgi:hypothetical protein